MICLDQRRGKEERCGTVSSDRVLAACGVYVAFLAVLFVLLLETTHQERAATGELRRSEAALVAAAGARRGVVGLPAESAARLRVAAAERRIATAARDTRLAVFGGLAGSILLALLLGGFVVPAGWGWPGPRLSPTRGADFAAP